MKKFLLLIVVSSVIGSCSNSQTETTVEKRDSTITTDTTKNAESNIVTPPASNGQY
jgi:hypothetical protein